MPQASPADAGPSPLRLVAASEVEDGCRILRRSASTYLDGAEARVAELIDAATDLSSTSDELDMAARGWAQRYHLSASRANFLRALRLPAEATVLDVGSGCGAITRLLAERCAVVDSLEPVLARARVARKRTRDLGNVEVFVGEVSDLPAQPGYDIVCAVGVLEYSGGGSADLAPYRAFLDRLAALLRPGGTLVLAIENRLGVKYMAGSPEDHSGRPWDSLEDYPKPSPARTFSRRELGALLQGAGLDSALFLNAFPDYKLTRAVFADALFTQAPELSWRIPNFPSPDWVGRRPREVSERRLWETLVRAGLGPECGNSFVVLSSRGKPAPSLWPEGQLAAYYTPARRTPYATETRVAGSRRSIAFHRAPLDTAAAEDSGDLVLDITATAPYVRGAADFVDAVAVADDEGRRALLAQWVDLVRAAPAEQNLDVVPHNLLLDGKRRLVVIDREWRHRGFTHDDVIRRGILLLTLRLAEQTAPEQWPVDTVEALARHLGAMVGLPEDGSWLPDALRREAELQAQVGVFEADDRGAAADALMQILATQLGQLLRHMPLGERDHERVARADQFDAVAEELRLAREHIAWLDGTVAEQRGRAEAAEADAASAQRTIAGMVRSRSWKVTAPLRVATRYASTARERYRSGR